MSKTDAQGCILLKKKLLWIFKPGTGVGGEKCMIFFFFWNVHLNFFLGKNNDPTWTDILFNLGWLNLPRDALGTGQIIATSHDLTQTVAKEGKSPYFRET